MYMRPGGEEIERVQAEAPGTIDFIPNRPGQKKRHMEGDGITIQYGPENQIQSFTATSVTTRTESEPVKGKAQPPAITSSKGMAAQFEPKTGDLVQLEQWDDFKYQEGDRQAKADRAVARTGEGSDHTERLGAGLGSDRLDRREDDRDDSEDRRCAGGRRRHVDAHAG